MGMTGTQQLYHLADQYRLAVIYVFGSRAVEIAGRLEGRAATVSAPLSDVDIGVQPELGHRLTAQDRVEIVVALEALFGVKRVDLVVLPEAGPYLALDIIRGELIYCRNPDQQAEDELYILRRAGDLAYFEKERRKMILTGGGR
jgi:predicted nucleotidyltransferase